MGKLQEFRIEVFNNPSLIYYPGQCVTGRVTATLSEAKKFRGLSVTILGESHVRWTETHRYRSGGRTRTTTKTYSNHERYFKERVILYGSGSDTSGNNVELPEGCHQFPFQFILPQNIPHSYESHYGRVEYSLEAVIDKAWAFDKECLLPFQIINILNLGNIPDSQMPVQSGATKHFCCWCCKSGPLSAMVRLDRKSHVPGEKMVISAEITNLSDRNITKSKAILEMHVVYHATTKIKRCSTEIARLERGSIKEGETDVWNGELLEIPLTPPSKLEHCGIIDIEYTLNFSICCHGAMNLEIPLDVIIGTQSSNDVFYSAFQ